ncbi:unnamed protein product [Orchesella dallaii]|uniref:Protein sleepless n=1 Tax=Orchesella dallaii TaxID=48710 RepID=A0ABP1RM00_9HEXA
MGKLCLKMFLVYVLYSSKVAGLKCYNCVYQNEYHDGSGSEPSCQFGREPKSDFKVDCDSVDYIPVFHGKELFVPITSLPRSTPENSSEIVYQRGNWSYSCFTLDFSGKLVTSEELNITIRSCLARPSQPEPEMRNGNGKTSYKLRNKCYSEINSEIERKIEEDDIRTITAVLQPVFLDDAQAKVCNCNEDNCNGEIVRLYANGASKSSKISLFLPIVEFIYTFIWIVTT